MSAKAFQITCISIVCSTIYIGAIQRKYKSSVSLAFVEESNGDQWIPLTKGR